MMQLHKNVIDLEVSKDLNTPERFWLNFSTAQSQKDFDFFEPYRLHLLKVFIPQIPACTLTTSSENKP